MQRSNFEVDHDRCMITRANRHNFLICDIETTVGGTTGIMIKVFFDLQFRIYLTSLLTTKRCLNILIKSSSSLQVGLGQAAETPSGNSESSGPSKAVHSTRVQTFKSDV